MKRLLLGLCVLIGLAGTGYAAFITTDSKTVTVNTNAADFTVVAAVTGQTVRVSHIDAQNLGTGGKVAFQICDGPCGAATRKIGPFELSPATASTQGGGWSFVCSGQNCYFKVTPGNALLAQVDTGATNNVRVHVTYELYQQ